MIMKGSVGRIALLGVLLAISGAWFTDGSAAASEPLEARWSYRLTPQNIIFIDGKYPQRYGITVKPILFKTGIEARDGLIAGAIDVGELGVTPAITALARSQKDLAIVAVSSFGGGKYRVVVPKNSPIKSMDALRGKKLAIKVGSGNYTAFLMWAKAKGYDIKDFQINDVGDTEAMSAMEAGSVDAVIYWEPIPAILVAKGMAREIFNFDGFVQNPVYLVARRDWLKKSPQAATHLLAAWIEAQSLKTTSSGPGTAGTAGAACVADAGGPGAAGAEGAGDGGAEGPGDTGGALSGVGAGGAAAAAPSPA